MTYSISTKIHGEEITIWKNKTLEQLKKLMEVWGGIHDNIIIRVEEKK